MSRITAKAAMEQAKAKAARLTSSSNQPKSFYPEDKGGEKTGMAPVSPRQFKKGGKVVGKAAGGANAARADRAKRKAGGRIANEMVNRDLKAANKERDGGKDHVGGYKKGGKVASTKKPDLKKALLSSAAPAKAPAKAVAKAPLPKAPKIDEMKVDKSVKAATLPKLKDVAKPTDVDPAMSVKSDEHEDDEDEEDEETEGAMMKRGGRAKRNGGGRTGKSCGGTKNGCRIAALMGEMGDEGDAPTAEEYRKGNLGNGEYALKSGGRAKRKSGGRAKGKTNINIVIASPGGDQAQPPMPPMAMPPRGVPAPAPAMAGQPPMPGMPPMGAGGPPMPAPGGAPPMRKAGGRINASYFSKKGGGGSGLGRLQKAH